MRARTRNVKLALMRSRWNALRVPVSSGKEAQELPRLAVGAFDGRDEAVNCGGACGHRTVRRYADAIAAGA